MIDNLKEAITHAKEVEEMDRREAEELREYGESSSPPSQPYNLAVKACLECAKEHEQLAEWLTELQERREADRWIPVSERLPEGMGTYLVTLEYKEHGKGVTTLWYHGKQIGWDLRVADVVTAWKPLPKPYESEEEE